MTFECLQQNVTQLEKKESSNFELNGFPYKKQKDIKTKIIIQACPTHRIFYKITKIPAKHIKKRFLLPQATTRIMVASEATRKNAKEVDN